MGLEPVCAGVLKCWKSNDLQIEWIPTTDIQVLSMGFMGTIWPSGYTYSSPSTLAFAFTNVLCAFTYLLT